MALTDITARNAVPREKAYRLADGGGMYLEISPTGNKWWRLKYRFAVRMEVTQRRAALQLLALIVLTTLLYLTAYALERR